MTINKLLYAVCLTLFVSSYVSAQETHGAAVTVLVKSSVSWDGQDLPDYAPGKPEITILRITIPPGSQLPVHRHPVINAGVLLRGDLTVVSEDGKILRLKPGESIVELVNTWHYGKNEGDAPVELIMFYAGKTGMPISVNKEVVPDIRPVQPSIAPSSP
jgi:quercetin dioxygenase-like cupin family protein